MLRVGRRGRDDIAALRSAAASPEERPCLDSPARERMSVSLLRFLHATFGRFVFRGKKIVTVAIAAGPMLLLGPTSSYTFITTDLSGANGTGAGGSDNAGQTVSTFMDAAEGLTHGFVKDGSTYATVDLAMNTSVLGINNPVQLAGNTGPGYGLVDTPVPEPSAALLLAVGLVGLAIRHHRV